VVIGMLNLVFGCSAAADKYDAILKKQLRDTYQIDLLPNELKKSLRVHMTENSAVDGRWMVFSRLREMMGFRFSRRAVQRFKMLPGQSNEAQATLQLEMFERAEPLDDTDLEEIGERVKHLGFVAAAQGAHFYFKGLQAMVSDIRSCPFLFGMAVQKLEEALDCTCAMLSF
jgi:hypothetical protein